MSKGYTSLLIMLRLFEQCSKQLHFSLAMVFLMMCLPVKCSFFYDVPHGRQGLFWCKIYFRTHKIIIYIQGVFFTGLPLQVLSVVIPIEKVSSVRISYGSGTQSLFGRKKGHNSESGFSIFNWLCYHTILLARSLCMQQIALLCLQICVSTQQAVGTLYIRGNF